MKPRSLLLAMLLLSTPYVCAETPPIGAAAPASEPQAAATASTPQASAPATVAPPPTPAPAEAPRAEMQQPVVSPATTASPEQIAALRAAQARLLQLFTRKDGTPASIVVFTPMDFTNWKFADPIAHAIRDDIARNGQFKIKIEKYVLKSLTLEEFRRAMTEYDADVLITTILKPDNFYIYLYDRRTPYYIYAHNEAIPLQIQQQMSEPIADYYAKVIERRVLYRYMQEQYFELPREESSPVLRSEIPRWIASNESLQLVNHDLESRFYAAVGMGAAFSTGDSKQFWNSNVFTLAAGYRFLRHSRFYVEAAFESFSYTALVGSVRYLFLTKDSPFRFSAGLGLGSLSRRKSINADLTPGLGEGGTYVVPVFSVQVPIIDAYFRIESRVYVGSGYVLSINPGIVIPF